LDTSQTNGRNIDNINTRRKKKMADEVWTNDEELGVTLRVPGQADEKYDEVTAVMLQDIAADAGISKFRVKDGEGRLINKSSFPVTSGTVVIEEYNEAKAGSKSHVKKKPAKSKARRK
jgi:2'-5' RNA ligase